MRVEHALPGKVVGRGLLRVQGGVRNGAELGRRRRRNGTAREVGQHLPAPAAQVQEVLLQRILVVTEQRRQRWQRPTSQEGRERGPSPLSLREAASPPSLPRRLPHRLHVRLDGARLPAGTRQGAEVRVLQVRQRPPSRRDRLALTSRRRRRAISNSRQAAPHPLKLRCGRVRALRAGRERRPQLDRAGQDPGLRRSPGHQGRHPRGILHAHPRGLHPLLRQVRRQVGGQAQQEVLRREGLREGGDAPRPALLPGRILPSAEDTPRGRERHGVAGRRRGHGRALQGGARTDRDVHRRLPHEALPADGTGGHRVDEDMPTGDGHRSPAALFGGRRASHVAGGGGAVCQAQRRGEEDERGRRQRRRRQRREEAVVRVLRRRRHAPVRDQDGRPHQPEQSGSGGRRTRRHRDPRRQAAAHPGHPGGGEKAGPQA
mmetsp:Transcript_12638/g.27262  ORF Transcript_12638/g.27262 Transcript_12638/m.27262 type:complete len:431 (+) Transcript_12638:1013-2305(+)